MVQQTLVDSDGHNDWVIDFSVDIEASREAAAPVLTLVQIAAI
jgi:hypothetical protein